MKIRLGILLLFLLPISLTAQTPAFNANQFKEDFNFFWNTINDEYCYFNKKPIDWQQVKSIYSATIDTIKTREQFVGLLEEIFYEIYDHHASLHTNTETSQRLVPSRTDIWAEYVNGHALITELRPNYGCEKAGIFAGMEVVAVNDIPVQDAIKTFLPKTLTRTDDEARSYALRMLLAGNHVPARKFTLKYGTSTKEYYPDNNGMQLESINYKSRVETKILEGNIGYIKINNCLFENQLVAEFDSVMLQMKNTNSLILDLRETPSGGNTVVARAILGWFINKDHFYQKHEYYAEEKAYGVKRSWKEIVSPRAGKYYAKPLAVLCNHWTGSIAEGITIGFDGLKRPSTFIIGTKMARLNGAVSSFEMPNTKIGFSFPNERLYHINDLPREEYIPPVYIDLLKENTAGKQDVFIAKALQLFKRR